MGVLFNILLHSGEKTFVCRSTLKSGDQWGFGRRFGRADALGRHLRSEGGILCIEPLLDEEATERGMLREVGSNSGLDKFTVTPGCIVKAVSCSS